MKIQKAAITSRVGRRMLALFILCALVPISGLAIISFLQVRSNLKRQTITRLWAIVLIAESVTPDNIERIEVVNGWLREVLAELTAIIL